MAYFAAVHRASSVRHAVKLNFLSPDEECLVVAKSHRLEFYTQAAEGLSLQYTRAIYGKITMLQKLRSASRTTDDLFIGTDGYNYFVVSWDPSTKQLRTEKSYVDLSDKTGRDSQSADRCLIDPARRFLALELFEGIVTVFPIGQKHKRKGDLEQGTLGEPVPVRIPELFVRSYAFLHNRNGEKEKTKLAILYEDGHEKVELIIRTLEYLPGLSGEPGSADLIEEDKRDRLQEDFDFGASHIIPIPTPPCGFFVLSETSITYVSDPSYETLVEPLRQATIYVTWTQVDAQRWLLADDYGSLYFLMLILEDSEVVGWKLDFLGKASRASVLIYLDSGLVYIGSHQGDSQLVRIGEKSLSVIQTFSNIAPILDFTIMDMGSRSGEGQVNEFSSGQARIVTGSGAYQDGSLRSVRSGVGLEELGSLGEMHHITEIFGVCSSSASEKADTLVVSFIDETRVFGFNEDGEVEESEEYKGIILSENTLLVQNLPQDRLLQVTATTVQITELESGMSTSTWKPPGGQTIVAASANGHDLVVSVGGTELFILNLFEDLHITSQKTFGTDNQIACIDMPSVTPNTVIVGFWRDAVVTISDIRTLNELQTFRVNEEAAAVPRSVILTQVLAEQHPTLFIAMADGNVVTYSVNPSTLAVSEKNSTVLGTQQASLKAVRREGGLFNVFATCEHPSMIYGSEGRIIYSAVTAEQATCICPFDSIAYPGAIAIATSEDLKIALIDTERTTHVQTLHVGETVRRIAYSAKQKSFGFGTIKRTLTGAVEVVQSYFKLADEIVFEELDKFALGEDEIIESVARIDVVRDDGEISERFIVGTAYLDTYPTRSTRGRILVFEVTADRLLSRTAEVALKGACRALAIMDGMIVAALTKTVVVYSLKDNNALLEKRATYRTATAPISLAVSGNLIAVADVMKSVSVVRYQPGADGNPPTLTEVARHFLTAWATAVAHVADHTYLESDADGNLLVLRQNIEGVTADDRRRLECVAECRLGEMVNRIVRLNISDTGRGDETVLPRAFMATADGSIYLFALIHPSRQDLLMRLQSNIARLVSGPGNVPFLKFRAFRNEVREGDEPFRFVDGELVERFLDCGPEVQEEIVSGLGVDVEAVKVMVEGLRRLS